jgi:hypothetical protein
MIDSRWLVALALGLVVVGVSVAMIAGLSYEPEPQQERADDWEDDWEHESAPRRGETEAQPADEPAEPQADEDEIVEGWRELTGVVSDSAGDPLEGVEVEVEGYGRLRTVTDENGSYRIHSVPTAPVTLVARASGFSETRVEAPRSEPDEEHTADVTLADSTGAAGMVLNPDGAPVSGAEVGCVRDLQQQRGVTTDRYGRFELPGTSIGCDAVARQRGLADSARVKLERGSRNFLVLAPLASIAGVVRYAGGRAPRSFTVTIESFTPAGGAEQARSYRHTFANPRGSFTVPGLTAGTYVLGVTLPRGQQVSSTPIEVKPGQQVKGVQITAP